jgi:hypothetical protein
MILDEATGRLVAGHGRLEALAQAKAGGREPPARIRVEGEEWWVPIVRGVAFTDEKEAEAYLLADNRLTMLGEWDTDALAEILREHRDHLDGIGWSEDSVDSLLAGLNKPETLELLRQKWMVERGARWRIPSVTAPGIEHAVMCGDSFSPEDRARLLAGVIPDGVITDPPYEMGWKQVRAAVQALASRAVMLANISEQGFKAFVTGGWRISFVLTWVHRQPRTTGHLKYPVIYSNLVFFARRGKTPLAWRRPHRNFGSVIVVDGPEYEADLHGHGKAVGLFEAMLKGFKVPTWSDPFLGTGASLLAAERLGRRLFGMELDPVRCAVALERLTRHGLTPERVT